MNQNGQVLIGVRPIKLLRRLAEEMGEQEAIDDFQKDLLVSKEKTALSVRTMRCEQEILALSKPESFSLYVSIPFCPTRCAYCSFVAQTLKQTARFGAKICGSALSGACLYGAGGKGFGSALGIGVYRRRHANYLICRSE